MRKNKAPCRPRKPSGSLPPPSHTHLCRTLPFLPAACLCREHFATRALGPSALVRAGGARWSRGALETNMPQEHGSGSPAQFLWWLQKNVFLALAPPILPTHMESARAPALLLFLGHLSGSTRCLYQVFLSAKCFPALFVPYHGGTEPRRKGIPLSAQHVHCCAVFWLKVRDSWNCCRLVMLCYNAFASKPVKLHKSLRSTGGNDCHMQNMTAHLYLGVRGLLFYIVAWPGISKTAAVFNSFKNCTRNRRCFNFFKIISKKKLL